MPASSVLVAMVAMLTIPVRSALDPRPGGLMDACKTQGCNDCPQYASVEQAYPSCFVYDADLNLGGRGFDNSDGNGYDVWWNSGNPEPGCRIIVRSPAYAAEPECGLYLTSWDVGGCYYTPVKDSFMLQYCCGTSCDNVAPSKRSIDDVHAAHLTGISSSTALVLENMTRTDVSGSSNIGAGNTIQWGRRRRSVAPGRRAQLPSMTSEDASMSAEVSSPLPKRCDDSYTVQRTYTKAGNQQRVSATSVCNSDRCMIKIMESVSTGTSFEFSSGFNVGVIEASLSITVEQTKERSIQYSFAQQQGTNGYVSFAPYYDCWYGDYYHCGSGSNDDGEVCQPRLTSQGFQDGIYSFVYVYDKVGS